MRRDFQNRSDNSIVWSFHLFSITALLRLFLSVSGSRNHESFHPPRRKTIGENGKERNRQPARSVSDEEDSQGFVRWNQWPGESCSGNPCAPVTGLRWRSRSRFLSSGIRRLCFSITLVGHHAYGGADRGLPSFGNMIERKGKINFFCVAATLPEGLVIVLLEYGGNRSCGDWNQQCVYILSIYMFYSLLPTKRGKNLFCYKQHKNNILSLFVVFLSLGLKKSWH